MISDDRPQNMIIGLAIIIGVISAFSLASTTTYYTGTIYMVRYMDINLEEISISGLDINNKSTDILMRLVFNFQIPDTSTGSVRLTYIAAQVIVIIDDVADELSYTVFRRDISRQDGQLTPNFNRNFTIYGPITDSTDRNTLYNASVADSWNFSIELRYFYQSFGSTADDVNIRLYLIDQVRLT